MLCKTGHVFYEICNKNKRTQNGALGSINHQTACDTAREVPSLWRLYCADKPPISLQLLRFQDLHPNVHKLQLKAESNDGRFLLSLDKRGTQSFAGPVSQTFLTLLMF